MHNQEPIPDVLAHVAANLRRLRRERGLSQIALAEASGISRRLIIGVESGEANVSLASLDKLANALEVGFVDLVTEPGRTGPHIDTVAWCGAPGSAARLLSAVPARAEAQLWIWELAPGDRYLAEPDPPGWHEMIFVIKGTLTVKTESATTILGANDFTVFSTSQSYSYHNDGPDPVRFVKNVVN
ncbi:MAG TPA: XRE family transcriptional regulator [Paracoccus sp. (in: a-proteobacteria)]|uniref:helix-turn-helix domain-containing protein n=1 Tax=Paracoccus sp. TaxID=267 RepID=UPI002D152C99|nr:XRE family transcriptional regulator [Paracoccus sp. (in: a-proteobacteria)]HWL59250.1 XRE family transcriptional regulator [Paracoccus sp. (in: a-proteobacteria)]